MGGLFTAWCFINTKRVFTQFGINSPSLWWNSNEVLTQAESFFDTHKTLGIPFTKVFISVGEKEDPIMNSVMEKYRLALGQRFYMPGSALLRTALTAGMLWHLTKHSWNIFFAITHIFLD